MKHPFLRSFKSFFWCFVILMGCVISAQTPSYANDEIDKPCEYIGAEVLDSYAISVRDRKQSERLNIQRQGSEKIALQENARKNLIENLRPLMNIYADLTCGRRDLIDAMECIEDQPQNSEECIHDFID